MSKRTNPRTISKTDKTGSFSKSSPKSSPKVVRKGRFLVVKGAVSVADPIKATRAERVRQLHGRD